MKIATKREIEKSKSIEAAQEIDRGLKLAKRVDELRATKVKEERDLTKWHDETLKVVQAEIDTKIVERDALTKQNAALAEDRLRLQAPVDLTQEWQKVNTDRLELEEWKRQLFEREASVISRELVLHSLPEREDEVAKKEQRAEAYLAETNKSYDVVESLRKDMEARKREADAEIEKRNATLNDRELSISEREALIDKKKEQLVGEERELLTRGTGLIARETTVEAKTNELFEREEKVKESEAVSREYLATSKHNYDESDAVRKKAEAYLAETETDISEQYQQLTDKQHKLAVIERDLNLERESLEREKSKLADDKIHIQSQQQTLRTAWDEIRKLKAK